MSKYVRLLSILCKIRTRMSHDYSLKEKKLFLLFTNILAITYVTAKELF